MSKFEVFIRKFAPVLLIALISIGLQPRVSAQTSSATLSVTISDTSGAMIPDATVVVRNSETNQEQRTVTARSGIGTFSFLKPGHYALTVSKEHFSDIAVDKIVLNVGDEKHVQLVLKVGSTAQTVTVDGGGATINTTDGSVSTVIDNKFVENTPLNGRSFQGLITLSPGVVTNSPQRASTLGTYGEFSVNGQRTESNYYTVDGVSANTGASTNLNGAGISGSLPGATALGTTQALVSVDALQEFRVESSTYSAEYGRNPGGQFSMVTRSGTNGWHGSVFDYFRNDALDANSWFNDHTTPVSPKNAERQNDFGGTFGGRVLIPHFYDGKDKTFFFVSYEGLRLVQPSDASINYVPTLALRQAAPSPLNQVLNAFPLPTPGAPDLGDGLTEFIAGWSNPSRLDSTSVRLDQSLGSKTRVFFRFSNTPSTSSTRGTSANESQSSPNDVTKALFGGRTYTAGVTTTFGPRSNNDFRVNFTSSDASSLETVDTFGGGQPINLVQIQGLNPNLPSYTMAVGIDIDVYGPELDAIKQTGTQKQWNIVDTFSTLLGKHQLKMGVDWRRLSPFHSSVGAGATYYYYYEASVLANSVDNGSGSSYGPGYPVYTNFSMFLQDEWRLTPRLSLSSGVRWDVNPAPGVSSGQMPYTVTGLNNLPALKLAPQGTPLWQTAWYNFAPRLGFAYTANSEAGHETVFRGGGGVFFDTGQQTGSMEPDFTLRIPTEQIMAYQRAFRFPRRPQTPPIITPPTAPYGIVYANPQHFQGALYIPVERELRASARQGSIPHAVICGGKWKKAY